MQNWSGCNGMNIGDVTALKDTRDNDVYAVAKLADGKCWMIENLRLDNVPTLSSSNTNNPSLPLTNVYDTSSRSNHLSPTSAVPYDVTTAPEGWCNANTAACLDQSRVRTDNTTLFINNTAANYDFGGDVYSYGNYYNWAAAMANTAYFNSYNGASGSDAAGTSLCPTGWHLPLGGASTGALVNGANDSANRVGSFSYLDRKMGGTGVNDSTNLITSATMSTYLLKFPNNFVFSGAWNYDYTYDRGRSCSYWSSSASGSQTAYGLVFDNLDYSPGTSYYVKFVGSSVRCVAN